MSSSSNSSFNFSACEDEEEVVIVKQEEEIRPKKRKKKRVVGRRKRHRPSSDEYDGAAPRISKRANGGVTSANTASPTHEDEDQELLFQDDGTGIKPIRPSALRFTMKVVEREAAQTTKAIAASLMENGQEDESRRVLVHSSEHASKIVHEVREKLRQVNMPARYVRIMDVSLECIDATNRKREHDIEDVRNQLARLKKKKKVFEAEYQKAKMQCNELRAKLGRKRETPEISRTHPLLKEFVSNNESANNPNDVILAQFDENLAVKRPDDERKFISVLLGQISSVYD